MKCFLNIKNIDQLSFSFKKTTEKKLVSEVEKL